MAQWVKKLTAAAQVSAKVQAGPLAWYRELKDLVSQQLWLRFEPWPRNFHTLWVQPFKKKKKKKKKKSKIGSWQAEDPREPVV